nr:Phage-like element PbsX protein XkdW [uncultured Mediterranean phage uvMED]
MAQLSTKIKSYCETNGVSNVSFREDVILQDDSDGNGAYIKEWNLDITQPTQAQLDALESQAQTYENNQQIIATRKKLYGSWGSQLEEIYDDGIDSWKARILQIKTDNPKE